MDPIVVINPNSSVRISEQIGVAAQSVVQSEPLRVVTSLDGPEAIESDQDVADAVAPMIGLAETVSAAAFVVACFSDPGVDELRSAVDVPCFGIAECAVLMAMSQARKVGIVSSVDASIPRHARYWDRLGISGRVVSDRAIGRGVLDLEGPDAFADTLSTARAVVADGADCVILGCTGLAHARSALERELNVPVVDPCQAATSMAVSVLQSRKSE